jgi:hypothetical protein
MKTDYRNELIIKKGEIDTLLENHRKADRPPITDYVIQVVCGTNDSAPFVSEHWFIATTEGGGRVVAQIGQKREWEDPEDVQNSNS